MNAPFKSAPQAVNDDEDDDDESKTELDHFLRLRLRFVPLFPRTNKVARFKWSSDFSFARVFSKGKGALNRCLNFPKMAEKSELNQQNLPVEKTILNKKKWIGIADS